jgi:hypothetical protein
MHLHILVVWLMYGLDAMRIPRRKFLLVQKVGTFLELAPAKRTAYPEEDSVS